MARLFISHSSADNAAAKALTLWLAEQGYDDVFLDIDPERGLVAGQRWQEALKAAADLCEAVLFLVSPAWLQSRWCLAEFLLAKSLHKSIFGLIIDPVPLDQLPAEMTAEWQLCDLVGDDRFRTFEVEVLGRSAQVEFREAGLDLLRRGLERAGLDAKHFPWPPRDEPRRAPYRGLKALEPQDAAIFFGRDAWIVRGLDRIRGAADRGVEKMLVILGASGSGKSSFLRAGLWPRLLRDDLNFLPLPIVRPQTAVITGSTGLAASLAGAFKRLGESRSPGRLREVLADGFEGFLHLIEELSALARRRRVALSEPAGNPVVVLPLDQAEELFNPEGSAEAAAFIDLLAHLPASAEGPPIENNATRLLVVATMRSDRLELLQNEPRLEKIKRDLFDLPPIPAAEFKSVVEGPARRTAEAGGRLAFDPALTERLIAEAAGADALPLLGFTLERLYADYGAEGRLTLAEYERLGGVQGSIEAAVAAALAEPGRAPAIPAEREVQFAALRAAFIPWLARIDQESAAPMRRVARRDEIPERSRAIVDRLVEARLLIADRRDSFDVVEIAHESLLRQWPALTGWLGEDRADLQLLSRLEQEEARWRIATTGYKDGLLLPSGIRLTEAEDLLARRPDLLDAEVDVVSFIKVSTESNTRRQAEVDEARRRRLYQARLAAAIMAVLFVISISSAAVLAIGVSRVQYGFARAIGALAVKTSSYPLSLTEKAIDNLNSDVATIRELLLSRVAGINNNPELSSAWTLAQMAVALEGDGASSLTHDTLRLFMAKNADNNCSCWKETADKMPHTVATAWVLYSLARYQIRPEHGSVSWLLSAQRSRGWWAMFPTTDDRRNASTSATAWAVLALNELRARHLLSSSDETLAAEATRKGIAWLRETRIIGKARWKEYPDGQAVDGDYAGVSALTLHVLRYVDAKDWDSALDSIWLSDLPSNAPGLFDYDQSKGLLYLSDNSLAVDEVRHYQLPWMLRVTVDAYSSGTLLAKASAHLWMEGVFENPISTEQMKNRDWVAAELFISLKHSAAAVNNP
jgi:hypothetical protein